jgi:hypothetical protein
MKNIISEVLTFVYSIAHWVGVGAIKIVHSVFPNAQLPSNIIDAFGFLFVLTAFLILVQAAKKIGWIIMVIGWILILLRILLIVV